MERSEDFEKLNKNGGHKTSKNLKALFVNAFWKASFFFFFINFFLKKKCFDVTTICVLMNVLCVLIDECFVF
jgi:hypothetical protein